MTLMLQALKRFYMKFMYFMGIVIGNKVTIKWQLLRNTRLIRVTLGEASVRFLMLLGELSSHCLTAASSAANVNIGFSFCSVSPDLSCLLPGIVSQINYETPRPCLIGFLAWEPSCAMGMAIKHTHTQKAYQP